MIIIFMSFPDISASLVKESRFYNNFNQWGKDLFIYHCQYFHVFSFSVCP